MAATTTGPVFDSQGFQDLSKLDLPQEARDSLRSASRDDSVIDHRVTVDLDWWQSALADRDLKGGPVTGVDAGDVVTSGRAHISRRALFLLAADANTDHSGESALRLLWHALAWGVGTRKRNMNHRLDAIAAMPDLGNVLRDAGLKGAESPTDAYALLRPGRRNAVPWLGPSFFTKYLYFAGGGRPQHPSVILDAMVARSLRDLCGWSTLHGQGPWPAVTYGRYCELLGRWSAELSSSAKPVTTDQIEMWLFHRNGEPA